MSFHHISRRDILSLGGLAAGAALWPKSILAQTELNGAVLPPWAAGLMDIHHIDTGRGNATFIVAPDGTSILIDCGASNTSLSETSPPRPDDSRTPAQWVAQYIRRYAPHVSDDGLDYIVATHIHPDHIGDIPTGLVAGPDGYVPTGLSEIDQLIPAKRVIDRAFPQFGDQPPPEAPFTRNYLAWLQARRSAGRVVEAVSVGSNSQIIGKKLGNGAEFSVRAVAGNGRVWTGKGTNSRSVRGRHTSPADRLNENCLSIALVIRLGLFGYFTGGDLSFDTFDGRQPWADVETPAARAAGRVEVAVADHHGYFDAVGAESDRALDPQAYVIPSWHITHPGQQQLQRMLRAWPNERIRDVFALELLPQNRQMNARFDKSLKSTQGHVVVRVQPGGASYDIYVLDSARSETPVSSRFGPYRSRIK